MTDQVALEPRRPRELLATVMFGGAGERVPYALQVPPDFYDWAREQTGQNPTQRWHLDNGERLVGPRMFGKPLWDRPWGEPLEDPEVEQVLWERFRRYLPKIDNPTRRVTEYGCMTVRGSMYHLRRHYYPMAKMTSVRELADYPFPDWTEEWHWEGVEETVRDCLARGYWVSGSVGSIFETAWSCRGQQQFFLDFYENPKFAGFLLERTMADCEYKARRLAAMGVDSLEVGDDMGTQHGLFMSRAMLREWILSRWERVLGAARAMKPDIRVVFHTDGKIEEIIPDLIAIGATTVGPIQPELDDPEELKRIYGPRLVLKGTLSAKTLTFGSPEEVQAEVKTRVETGKRWGGLFLSSNNTPDYNTPWENMLTFLDAAEEYGGQGEGVRA